MESLTDPSDNLFKQRKLASVQKITSLTPMGKNGQEELATVLGWKVFVKGKMFKEGEKIIYFEIDSMLPEGKKWTRGIKPKNLRVKTEKRYNQVTQGMILKLDVLKKIDANMNIDELEEGHDLTEFLGITKFDENSEEGKKELEKAYPVNLIEKSDEIRVQSNLDYITIFSGKEFYSSLKYDGSSSTYLIDPETNKFRVCSRNIGLIEGEKDIYNDIAKKYDIKNKLIKVGGLYAIQGEIYGPKSK